VVAASKHDFAYRTIRLQAEAYEELSRRLSEVIDDWATDLEDAIRLLVAQVASIRSNVERSVEVIKRLPDPGAEELVYDTDDLFRIIGRHCAVLEAGIRVVKEHGAKLPLEDELLDAKAEYRRLHALVVPDLSGDEMDAVWEEQWTHPKERRRMPILLRLFPDFYANRPRYDTAAVAVSVVGVFLGLCLIGFGPLWALAGFATGILVSTAAVALVYTWEDE
jgi:hypothetical protein